VAPGGLTHGDVHQRSMHPRGRRKR
jgi:hypothetical protein